MKVLITGGLGYIGSHTAVELLQKGHEVVIVDNCFNASLDVLDQIYAITGLRPAFEKKDLRKPKDIQYIFQKYLDIEGIIHFAAFKSVEESTRKPLLYYQNNVHGLTYLLEELQRCGRKVYFVFSSSCTVYGVPRSLPISENTAWGAAISPYAYTKQIGETIVQDVCLANAFIDGVILRYFNPIGGHPSGNMGESPQNVPQNIVPIMVQIAAGNAKKKLQVYGGDYPTPDGTCVRDYLHVTDLAVAHMVALEKLYTNGGKGQKKPDVYNIGTGSGTSVLELIHLFQKATCIAISYEVVDRRSGDVPSIYADNTLVTQELGWFAKRPLEDALHSAWAWKQRTMES